MLIKEEISLADFQAWSGAVDTLDHIINEDKCDELEAILEDLYPDGMTDTELNDMLWFEEEQIYEWLGISDDDEEEMEEMESYLCFEDTDNFEEFCMENNCDYCKYKLCSSQKDCEENFYKDKEISMSVKYPSDDD